MKRYIDRIAWILFLTVLSGCQRQAEKDSLPHEKVVSEEQPQMIIKATIEGEAKTRTTLGHSGNGNYRPYWKEGDDIVIYDLSHNGFGRFTLLSGAGTDEAVFAGVGSGQDLVGLYPFSCMTSDGLRDNVLNMELPSIQEYEKDSFGNGAYPMLAVGRPSGLVFKNLCSILQLSVTGTDAIEAIRFVAHDSNMPVSGKATVRIDYDTVPELVMTDGESPEVVLQCNGVNLNPDAPTLFYLVIPAGTYKGGFEVEIISKIGKMIRSTQNDVTFARSQYRTIPSFAFVPEAEPLAVPEPVDLGLPSGLKWASFNLGASKPEDYGDYYAWGETEPYYYSQDPLIWKPGKESGYTWSSYQWWSGNALTKYCWSAEHGYNGYTDDKSVLDLEDDAAHVHLGDYWRMPTWDELVELQTNCTWTWTEQEGVSGRLVIGPNGHSIFLPAAADRYETVLGDVGMAGYYRSSSLHAERPTSAYELVFNQYGIYESGSSRTIGFSIRPVYDDRSATKIETHVPTNIGPCSVEIPFTISTQEVVNNFGIIYSTDTNDPVVGNYGDGGYFTSYSTDVGNSMIISELKTNTTYYARAFITLDEENGAKVYGNTIQFTTKELSYSAEYVDLGLSVAWATCNLGSSTPSNVGGYYGWGETVPTSFRTGGYKWSGPDGFIKYNAADGKVTLEASDDAANVILGGKWRMPTQDELTELRNSCTWTPATRDGVKGCKVTGPNGKSIFIPVSEGVTGFFNAIFLSSSLTYSDNAYNYVQALMYNYDNDNVSFLSTFRDWGTPIRPVYDDSEPIPEYSIPEPIDLGLSVKWASFNLGATVPEGNGYKFAWGETQPKGQYTLDNYLWYSRSDRKYTKYNWRSDYGAVDNKIFLDMEDDAASSNLGDGWRMPTGDEMIELMNQCDWTYFENYQDSGISGCVVRGKKDGYTENFIFIPSGVYHSSALEFSERIIQGPYAQQGMQISSGLYEDYHKYMVASTLYRASGNMIRPVFGSRSSYSVYPIDVEFGEVPVGTTAQEPVLITNTGEMPIEMNISMNAPFSVNETSISLKKGESMTIQVSFTPDQAVDYKGFSFVSVMDMPRSFWINVYGTGK